LKSELGGHSRSLKIAPFVRQFTTFFWSVIVCLSSIIWEIFVENRDFFPAFDAKLGDPSRSIAILSGIEKLELWLPDGEKFYDMFSRFNRRVTNRQTDGRTVIVTSLFAAV